MFSVNRYARQPPACQPPLKCQPVDDLRERFASDSAIRQRVFSFLDSLIIYITNSRLAGIRHLGSTGELVSSGFRRQTQIRSTNS